MRLSFCVVLVTILCTATLVLAEPTEPLPEPPSSTAKPTEPLPEPTTQPTEPATGEEEAANVASDGALEKKPPRPFGARLKMVTVAGSPNDTHEESRALEVLSVRPGGAADRAKIRAGDILLKVGGTRVTSGAELRSALDSLSNESTVEVVIDRGGTRLTLIVFGATIAPGSEPVRRERMDGVIERARDADEALTSKVGADLPCGSSLPIHVEPELEGYDVIGLVAGWTREELVRYACEVGAEAVVGLRTDELGLSGIAVARPGSAGPRDPPLPVAATGPPAVNQDHVPNAPPERTVQPPVEEPEYTPPVGRPRTARRFKSEPTGPAGAVLLSLLAMMGGASVGWLAGMTGMRDLGISLTIAGSLIGPSVGLMFARRNGRAWVQVGIRAALYTAAFITLLVAAYSHGDATGWLLASGGLAFGAASVSIYSIVDGGIHAAENREAWEAQRRRSFGGPYGWRLAPLLMKDGGGAAIACAF